MTLVPAFLLQDDGGAVAGGIAALLGGGMFLVFMAIGLAMIAGMWKAFVKAGQPGWACLVPIYNLYIMTIIAGKPAWWIALMLVPFVSLVVVILLNIEIAKAFGQGAGMGILMCLGIGWLMLGFGSAQYVGRGGMASAAVA